MKKGNQSKLKVAKSSQGYYVGWLFQEDEVTKSFVRLTDYLMSKEEALEWVDAIIVELEERKEG
jgi:hypothetical protein